MKSAQYSYNREQWTEHSRSDALDYHTVQLVLAFGNKTLLQGDLIYTYLRQRFPVADIALCSTAGEIFGTEVHDETVVAIAIHFDHTPIAAHSITIGEEENSYEAGIRLLQQFNTDGLVSLFLLSDGSRVNGSELVRAFNTLENKDILVTGGMAGDGDHFHTTLAGLNRSPEEGVILGIGFYGDKLLVGHGSRGGWEMFGLEKTVTRSRDNVLFEIDGKNALELYKKYLGPEASLLPGSALLFPLSVTIPQTGEKVVRTILSIDQQDGSMTFAGDIPEGASVRFMRANFDKITNAAADAACQAQHSGAMQPHLAVLVSCVGRKLILQSRADEGPEAIDEVFGHKTMIGGFYSYGEISPVVKNGPCQLHNQTMTITTFYEKE